MERLRRENLTRGRLMSSSERVQRWRRRQGVGEEELSQTQEGIRGETRRRNVDRPRPPGLRKNPGIYIELKPFAKAKTARDPAESRPETRRFRKPSDKLWRKELLVPPDRHEKFANFGNTWDRTNYSEVPCAVADPLESLAGRERKAKRDRSRKQRRSVSGQRPEKGNKKEIPAGRKRKTRVEVLYPTIDCCVKDREKWMNQSEGKTVVIYKRQNRRNCLHQQTGDNYLLEQIAFAGGCQAAIDLVQSKRSLSEPRQSSLKEFYIASRKTRLHLEPKMASTQSDFRSAIDFLQQGRVSAEFGKVEKIKDKLPSEGEQNLAGAADQTGNADSGGEVGRRLKQTAEKKLDLHREMIRAERMHKKKFWESIERSLNYRCALAEMFSSQSFVARDESSKFFSSTEKSTGRSAEIYVRESVIEKISSYQGFHRFVGANMLGARNGTNGRITTPPPASTYRKMKSVLGSILIKEDEEEEILVKRGLEDDLSSRTSSESSIRPEDTLYDTAGSLLPQTTSEKLMLMESSLVCGDETGSELELLMAKLSEEIRKCSYFIKKMDASTMARLRDDAKRSASDSNIRKTGARRTSPAGPVKNGEHVIYPVRIYAATKGTTESAADVRSRTVAVTQSKTRQVQRTTDVDSKDPTLTWSRRTRNEDFTPSLLSLRSDSWGSSADTRYPYARNRHPKEKTESPCCDDCRYLKRRIVKLEKELRRIERKIPFYPVEYQDSIKTCLERLKTTSETILKRLRSCAKLRYKEHQSDKCRKSQRHSRRTTSAPETIVHKGASEKLTLKSGNSDNHVNVGMKITMENVDPATGERLPPAVQGGPEQEGNIQCKVYKDGEDPILLMDSDFSYNPKTGMLFKNKNTANISSQRAELLLPLKEPLKGCPSDENMTEGSVAFPQSVRAHQCVLKGEEIPFEENVFLADTLAHKNPSTVSKKKSKGSIEVRKKREDSVEKAREQEAPEDKKKSKFPWFRKREALGKAAPSRIPTRRKPAPSSRPQSVCHNNSATSIFRLEGSSKNSPSASTSRGSLKTATKPTASNQTFQKRRLKRKIDKLDKSAQTYESFRTEAPKRKAVADKAVQTRLPARHHEEIQTCARSFADRGTGVLEVSVEAGTTVNVAVQTDAERRDLPSAHVGLQTNLPTEEDLKHLNDLHVQKKVNMAIAELCFHLTKAKEQQKV